MTMFSVITHQTPEDAKYIFYMLRRYVSDRGRLFLTAQIDAKEEYYSESEPESPTAFSKHSLELIAKLLRLTGWAVDFHPTEKHGWIANDGIRYLCSPI